jgi:hypothetical protein
MRWLRLILATLSQVALLLPFLAFEDCTTGERRVYTGVEIAADSGGAFFALPMLVALFLLLRPVGPGPLNPGEGLRGFFAGVSLLSVSMAGFYRMFDHPEPKAGFVMATGSWLLLWLSCLARGFRRPIGWAHGALLLVPAGMAIAVQLSKGNRSDAIGVAFSTALLVLPLLPVFGALVGRARRRSWLVIGAVGALAGVSAQGEGWLYLPMGVLAAVAAVGLAQREAWRAREQAHEGNGL